MQDRRNEQSRELSRDELKAVTGGAVVPHITSPKFLYIDFTPEWVIANAISMGYEVQKI